MAATSAERQRAYRLRNKLRWNEAQMAIHRAKNRERVRQYRERKRRASSDGTAAVPTVPARPAPKVLSLAEVVSALSSQSLSQTLEQRFMSATVLARSPRSEMAHLVMQRRQTALRVFQWRDRRHQLEATTGPLSPSNRFVAQGIVIGAKSTVQDSLEHLENLAVSSLMAISRRPVVPPAPFRSSAIAIAG